MGLDNENTKITNISIHDGAVHVSVIPSEPEEETKEESVPEEEQTLFTTETGFKVLEDNTWIAWYTNAYKDKDKEIFKEKAIAADIDRMNDTDDYPPLWFWHIGATKHGQAVAAAKVGRFAVAVGVFDDTPMGEAFKSYYKNTPGLALSHGFLYDPRDKVDGVFKRYRTFEISVLPGESAANPFTAYSTKEKFAMGEITQKARDALIDALGEEAFEEIVSAGKEASEVLDKAGVAFKSNDTPKPEEGQGAVLGSLVTKMDGFITDMKERMDKLESQAKPKKGDEDEDEDDEEGEENAKPKKKGESEDKSRSELYGSVQQKVQEKLLTQLLTDMLENKQKDSIEDRKSMSDDPAGALWDKLAPGDGK